MSLTLNRGAYALSDGAFALWAAISRRGRGAGSRWWLALAGVTGILSGLIAFLLPDMTALVRLMFIASWAIIAGLLQIWSAIQLRKEIKDECLLFLNGLLPNAFGAIAIARPGAGALALVWMIAWFAIFAGCIYIPLSFRLKKLAPEA